MSKILDKNRLDFSDSFIKSNLNMLTCRSCDQILIPRFEPKGCAC